VTALQSGPHLGISRQSSWLWHMRHTQVSGKNPFMNESRAPQRGHTV
jgi:hypothetical protein